MPVRASINQCVPGLVFFRLLRMKCDLVLIWLVWLYLYFYGSCFPRRRQGLRRHQSLLQVGLRFITAPPPAFVFPSPASRWRPPAAPARNGTRSNSACFL